MSRSGPGPFDSDQALDFVHYLEELDEPERELHEMLEAILDEDGYLHDDVMEIGMAAAATVAVLLDGGRTLDPEWEPALPDISVTDRLRLLALGVMECAVQPWDRRTGHNMTYDTWESMGRAQQYRQALEPYLRVLAAGVKTSIDEPRDPGYSWTGKTERTPSEAEIGLMRERLLSLAPAFRAFPVQVFGERSPEEFDGLHVFAEETFQIIAGACIHRSGELIEDVRHDLEVLREARGTVADIGPNRFRQLRDLPWRFASSYDEEFAGRFLESAIGATTLLTRSGRLRPRTIAEYLAMRSVTEALGDLTRRYGELDENSRWVLNSRISQAFAYTETGVSDLRLSFSSSTGTLSRITPLLGTVWLEAFGEPRLVPPGEWFLPFTGDSER
ncbi:DUF4259 domain-containing protein [Streptosporangium minutum]|nr:DUF4259 domain-containing protein [Streptosporangium minutum]